MPGKWAKYHKNYNPKWEEEDALKDWIAPAPLNDRYDGKAKAYCKFCEIYLRAHHGDLIAHSKRARHKTKALIIHNGLVPEQLSKSENLDTEEETLDEVLVNEDDYDQVAIELFKGEEPLLKRVNPKMELRLKQSENDKSQIEEFELCSAFTQCENVGDLSLGPQSPNYSCDAHPQNPNSACKWQKLVEEKILAVQEKRKQQTIEHNLVKAEYNLRMKIMQEESSLKRQKLELEILSLEKALLQVDNK